MIRRRNPDKDIRGLERALHGERSVHNLIQLHHSAYRAGLPGVARPKLMSWWEAASIPTFESGSTLTVIGDPVHPTNVLRLDEVDADVLNGYYKGYEVTVRHYFDRPWLHGPMNTTMAVIVGTGGGGYFPSGRKAYAWMLDSDLMSITTPHDEDQKIRRDEGVATYKPWREDRLILNEYSHLTDLLHDMAESLFLYDEGPYLVDKGRDMCGNCGQEHQIRTRFGHQYYICTDCKGFTSNLMAAE